MTQLSDLEPFLAAILKFLLENLIFLFDETELN